MKRVAHFLYLVDDVPRMLTEQEAEDLKKSGVDVWNMHRVFDIEPDFLVK